MISGKTHCGSITLKRNPTPLQPLSLKTQRLTSVKSRLIKSSTGERKDTYDFVVNCPFKLSILLNTDRISSKGERGFYSQQPIRKYSSVVQPSFRSVIKSISDTNKHTHTHQQGLCASPQTDDCVPMLRTLKETKSCAPLMCCLLK